MTARTALVSVIAFALTRCKAHFRAMAQSHNTDEAREVAAQIIADQIAAPEVAHGGDPGEPGGEAAKGLHGRAGRGADRGVRPHPGSAPTAAGWGGAISTARISPRRWSGPGWRGTARGSRVASTRHAVISSAGSGPGSIHRRAASVARFLCAKSRSTLSHDAVLPTSDGSPATPRTAGSSRIRGWPSRPLFSARLIGYLGRQYPGNGSARAAGCSAADAPSNLGSLSSSSRSRLTKPSLSGYSIELSSFNRSRFFLLEPRFIIIL